MKQKMMVLGVVVLFLTAGYVSAGENHEHEKTESTKEVDVKKKKEPITFCPICGPEDELHGLSFSYKYKGTKYPFCSMGCLKAFKKDPEKFLKEIEKGSEGEYTQEHGHDLEGHGH